MSAYGEIDRLFAVRGDELYGESVTQRAHALQAAAAAVREGAAAPDIVAALLHDVGHLLDHDDPQTGDVHHSDSGADFLARFFGADVTEPVRLHVAAKRWLCATEPGYLERLSPASVHSLVLQGGSFAGAAARRFETSPWFASAVALRRRDEAAKEPERRVPPLADYRALIERLAAGQAGTSP